MLNNVLLKDFLKSFLNGYDSGDCKSPLYAMNFIDEY